MSDKLRKITLAAALVALVAMSALYVFENNKRTKYQLFLDAIYNKSFYDLLGNMRNIDINLSKAMVASSETQKRKYFELISRHAEKAEINLSQMPIALETIEKTMKYINQLCDYTKSLCKNIRTDDQTTSNLTALKKVSSQLNAELNVLGARIAEGQNMFSQECLRKSGKPMPNSISDGFSRIQETSIEYPKLIYDGPFSENNLRVKPKSEFEKINKETAKKKVKELFNGEVEPASDIDSVYKSFGFKVKSGKSESLIQVSENNGYIVWLINEREVPESKLTLEQCRDKAIEFVKKAYMPMTAVWAQAVENIAIINLTPEVNGAVIYPDMVKISVAMDNGEIVGIEGSSFINNYRKRTIEPPKISAEEARCSICSELKDRSQRLALIPVDSTEVLCYEFQGETDDGYFIIYVNAQTGEETEVFKVLDVSGSELIV
ncbi:MAG TPA: germination protein YpeB [Clostridia bacterium]|nr:germination protein YpeB [Clostridia bacterium]